MAITGVPPNSSFPWPGAPTPPQEQFSLIWWSCHETNWLPGAVPVFIGGNVPWVMTWPGGPVFPCQSNPSQSCGPSPKYICSDFNCEACYDGVLSFQLTTYDGCQLPIVGPTYDSSWNLLTPPSSGGGCPTHTWCSPAVPGGPSMAMEFNLQDASGNYYPLDFCFGPNGATTPGCPSFAAGNYPPNWSGTPASYRVEWFTPTLVANSVAYNNLPPGVFTFTVTKAECGGVIGLLPTQSPMTVVLGTPSNFNQIGGGFPPIHDNVDDCIACCGGLNIPTYTNGITNPYYGMTTHPTSHAGFATYLAGANPTNAPIPQSSGSFIDYMQTLGIDSCGQV